MPDPRAIDHRLVASKNSNRARDHLANERTFLAWVRTGVARVFGFAIGRFAIARRQFIQMQDHVTRTAGFSVWFVTIAIVTACC
jgi:putative membrane protein